MNGVGGRSLESVEDVVWGPPPPDATALVARVHDLRRRPIGELSVEHLRMLIGQQVGAAVLVPVALDRLAADPLVAGDFYPGDLLVAVLRLPASFWVARPDDRARLTAVLDRLEDGDVDAGLVAAFRGAGSR